MPQTINIQQGNKSRKEISVYTKQEIDSIILQSNRLTSRGSVGQLGGSNNNLESKFKQLDTNLGGLDSELNTLDSYFQNPDNIPAGYTFFEGIATKQAFVDNLVAGTAWIDTLTASTGWFDKLTSNQAFIDNLFANSITVTNTIQSSNYSAGVSGFFIDGGTGNAEFNNVTARGEFIGSLDASGNTITVGSLESQNDIIAYSSGGGTSIQDANYSVSDLNILNAINFKGTSLFNANDKINASWIDGGVVTDWTSLQNKPFGSVGSGLTITNDVLTANIRSDSSIRNLFSANGSLSYNALTGEFSYTQRSDTTIRALFSAGGDLSYNNGVFSVTTYKTSDFNTDFGNKSTTDLSEGDNLYFTNLRVKDVVSGASTFQTVGVGDDVEFGKGTFQDDVIAYSSGGGTSIQDSNYAVNDLTVNSQLYSPAAPPNTTDKSLFDTDGTIRNEFITGGTATSLAWGDITGTLSDQTDLQNVLNNKADTFANRSNLDSIDQDLGQADSVIFGAAQFNGDVTVDGNITQNGQAYINYAQQIKTTKDFIIQREGATGAIAGGAIAGSKVIKADGTNNVVFGTDNSAIARVGWEGDTLQALATREDAPTANGIPYWDNVNSMFATASDFTFDGSVLGVPSIDTGQGATEVHLMNQNLRTTDSPTFAGGTFTGKLQVERVTIRDKRNEDLSPLDYYHEWELTFQRFSKLTSNPYGYTGFGGLWTVAPWGSDNSGGKHTQIGLTQNGIFTRTGNPSSTSWDSWSVIAQDNMSRNFNFGGNLHVVGLLTAQDGLAVPGGNLDVTNNATIGGALSANTLRPDTGKFLSPVSYQFRNAGDTGFRDAEMAGLAATSATISGASDLQGLVTTHDDIIPHQNFTGNIGRSDRYYLTGRIAELYVPKLVVEEHLSTTGGVFYTGIGTVLSADIASTDTTISVKNNDLQNGEYIRLYARGQFEQMQVTSAYTDNGDGTYSYSVTRNIDGSGANAWKAGDGIFDTGATAGFGFIEQYATNSLTTGVSTSGPSVVYQVRTGTGVNDIAARAATGNLNGWYDYATDVYGAAFGDASGDHITIDPTNGIRFIGGSGTVGAQFTSGKLSIVSATGLGNFDDANADNITATASRKWAGESGADVTANNAQAVSWLTDAGALATSDNLDEVPDGSTYQRTKSAALTADGLVLLSQASGTIDNISDGTTYQRTKASALTAGGLVLLSQASGTLDNIANGSTYSKVLSTSISAGKIILGEATGDADDITAGTNNKFASESGADVTANHTAADIANLPATPSGQGLFASTTHLGYYDSGTWTSYIKNDGSGELASGNISWNPAGDVTLDPSVTIGYSSVTDKPTSNALNYKSSFEDGDAGFWEGTVVPVTGQSFSKALQVNGRDNYEQIPHFPVEEGETFRIEAWMKSDNTTHPSGIGLRFFDSSGGTVGFVKPSAFLSGQGWTKYTGSITAPVGAVEAEPWIQIDAHDTFGTVEVAQIRITRFGYITSTKITQTEIESPTFTGNRADLQTMLTVGGTSWQDTGIQLDYNAGTPRFFAGVNGGNFVRHDSTDFEFQATNTSLLGGTFTATDAVLTGKLTAGNVELGQDITNVFDAGNPTADGFYANDNNYWYGDGKKRFGGASKYVKWDGTDLLIEAGNASIGATSGSFANGVLTYSGANGGEVNFAGFTATVADNTISSFPSSYGIKLDSTDASLSLWKDTSTKSVVIAPDAVPATSTTLDSTTSADKTINYNDTGVYTSSTYSIGYPNETLEVYCVFNRVDNGDGITGFAHPIVSLQLYDGSTWTTVKEWDGGRINLVDQNRDIVFTYSVRETYTQARLQFWVKEWSTGPYGRDNVTFTDVAFGMYETNISLSHQTLTIAQSPHATVKIGGGYNELATVVSGNGGDSSTWDSIYAKPFSNLSSDFTVTSDVLGLTNPFDPSGTYTGLRAQATTKADVGLGNVRNVSQYSQGEVDDFFSGTTSINGYNKSHWDTAYGWGDHSQAGYALASNLSAHINDTGNPHNVTASQLGLVIGTDVQAHDSQLDTLASFTATQVGHLGSIDQDLGQADSPTFAGGTFTSLLTAQDGLAVPGGNLDVTNNATVGQNITAYANGGGASIQEAAYSVDTLSIATQLNFQGTGLFDTDGTIKDSFITGGTASSIAWSNITSNPFSGYSPSNFAASTHSHSISDVTNLQSTLDAKLESSDLSGYATESWVTGQGYITGYTVTQSDVTSHASALNWSNLGISKSDVSKSDVGLSNLPNSIDLSDYDNSVSGFITSYVNNYLTGLSGSGDSTLTATIAGRSNVTVDLSHSHSEYYESGDTPTFAGGTFNGDVVRGDVTIFNVGIGINSTLTSGTRLTVGGRSDFQDNVTISSGLLTAQGVDSYTATSRDIGTINAVNGDVARWNNPSNSSLRAVNNNNALSIIVDGTPSGRKAMIQVGHSDSAYAEYLGDLFLNPLGGNVGIGTTSPSSKLDVNGLLTAQAGAAVPGGNLDVTNNAYFGGLLTAQDEIKCNGNITAYAS